MRKALYALLLCATGAGAQEFHLPTSIPEAAAMEKDFLLPVGSFYDAPALTGKPGDLLRQDVFTGYDLPKDITATRILYHSADATGHDVASSAVVLTPAKTAPKGGWPVIVWTHGTSGVARACAPSAMKNVYYGQELAKMVASGFAVIAVDYHGLGTQGPHQYMDTLAQGQDVVNALPAAHKAVESLGRKWAVDGHSQGGQAAWGVAELEAVRHDPGYLGAISVAGATHLPWSSQHQESLEGAGFYLAWVGYAIHARFPDFKPETMLSERAMADYHSVTEQGCWFTGFGAYSGVGAREMVKPGWEKDPSAKAFFDEIAVGRKPATGPILVIAGEADQSVPLDGIKDTVTHGCARGQQIHFHGYPGLDHEPVMEASLDEQIAWMRDRFAGKPAQSECGGAK